MHLEKEEVHDYGIHIVIIDQSGESRAIVVYSFYFRISRFKRPIDYLLREELIVPQIS
jgi:hypothetical protein